MELLMFGFAVGLMAGFVLGSISLREERRAVARQRERRGEATAEVVVAELVTEPRRLPAA